MIQFNLDDKQINTLRQWELKQNQKAINMQKLMITYNHPSIDIYRECWDEGFPYGGAIGGEFTYSFCPNSIGINISVKNAITGDVIDFSDYENW